jgi:uncharacterized protein YbaA (DUF1428 family)
MAKTKYVDGFVLPLKKDQIETYRTFATDAGKVWREHGALSYTECIADDVTYGEVTSFPRSLSLKDDELVVFAWIEYESRTHRDSVNDKVMKDPRMVGVDPKNFPFDAKRMYWGGFEVLVDV